MLVQNWMTTEVISVTPQTSLLKVGKLIRDHNIRRLPVLDDKEQLVGIVSDRDVRTASPSKATTLDMYEMNYLLAELKAKDIMTFNPVTVKPSDTVEDAAILMLDHKISGLPVMEESGRLVGILSDQDIFRAYVSITGAREPGVQLGIELPNTPGTLKPVFDLLRSHGARILSVLTSNTDEDTRCVFIRLRELNNAADIEKITVGVKELGRLLYCTRH